mgnify:CR=1 FL=1
MKIETFSAEETYALGKKLGSEANPGDVLTLVGDLGVGKTVFTQGFADGLGITEPISSPTFTIVQVYEEGRLPFYHFDVYRIGDIEEMDEIGYEDYFYGYSGAGDDSPLWEKINKKYNHTKSTKVISILEGSRLVFCTTLNCGFHFIFQSNQYNYKFY